MVAFAEQGGLYELHSAHLHNFGMLARRVQRGAALIVLVVHICTPLDVVLHQVNPASFPCLVQATGIVQ